MDKAYKGDWVEIARTLLQPEERAPNLPSDTASIPYTMRVRGTAMADARIGEAATIRTLGGRSYEGELIEVNPTYRHHFGEHVPELIEIRIRLKALLKKGGK